MHHYPFHIGDYVAHTRHLTPIEDLAYRRLLDAYYLREGPLPKDVEATARLIGLREYVPDVEAVLLEFFEEDDEGWRSARCDEEIEAFRAKQEQASRAGKASARSRASAREADDERMPNDGSTGVERPLNGRATNQNQNQNQVPPKAPKGGALFEEFWAAYPRKVGKDAARRSFERRKPGREMLDEMLLAIARQKQTRGWQDNGGQFIPNPSTWLHQGRWQDEQSAIELRPNGYVPMASPAGG